MTKVIYITGDRSIDPLTSVSLVSFVLAKIQHEEMVAKSDGVRFMTGNSKTGIEKAVRYLLPDPVVDVIHYDLNADGKPEFDESFKVVAPMVTDVYFLHPDPLASRIGKALHAHIDGEKIQMPLQDIA